MVMTRSEGMTMTARNKVRLEDWRRGEKEVRSQGDGRISQVDIEIPKNYNRDSYWMFLE